MKVTIITVVKNDIKNISSMNDDLALLNYGTAYRNLPPNLVQGGITRRFGSNTTLTPFSER